MLVDFFWHIITFSDCILLNQRCLFKAEKTEVWPLETLRKEQRKYLLWKSLICGCTQAVSTLYLQGKGLVKKKKTKPETKLWPEQERGKGNLSELRNSFQGWQNPDKAARLPCQSSTFGSSVRQRWSNWVGWKMFQEQEKTKWGEEKHSSNFCKIYLFSLGGRIKSLLWRVYLCDINKHRLPSLCEWIVMNLKLAGCVTAQGPNSSVLA